MKRKILIVILSIILLSFYFLKDLQVSISSVFRTEIFQNAHQNRKEKLSLRIPENVIKKFDEIYELYTDDFYSEKYVDFVRFLNSNNSWEEAELLFNGKIYRVKIKLQGKSPSQHIENNHYSFGVKILGGKKIKEVSRFNLIVYWRIRYKYDVIKFIAEKLGVYYQEDELFSVSINERDPKLYFFEYRVNAEFLRIRKLEKLIVLKEKSDHSLIYTGGDIESWNKKLRKAINKTAANDAVKKVLFEKYSSLNNAIYKQDVELTLSFFDIDYLAKIQVFRYIYADNGHGFKPNNLLVAFDTSNSKFYPFVHRDNSNIRLFRNQLGNSFNGDIPGIVTPLFQTLSKSELLAVKTEELLYNLLNEDSFSSTDIDSIVDYHQTLYYSSIIKERLAFSSRHSSSLNIEMLRNYFQILND